MTGPCPRPFHSPRGSSRPASCVSRRANRLGHFESLEPRALLDSTTVFNEVMYHPADDNSALEWIELHNQLGVNMDIGGWRLAGGVDYTFPTDTVILGRGYLVVAANPAAFAAAGFGGALGPFTGMLSNSGERIQLVNNSDRLMDALDYSDDLPWPVGADGSGFTLAKRDRDTNSSAPENWTVSRTAGGTPGSENFAEFDPTPVTSTLLDGTDTWKYNDTGADLGSAWTDANYNDNSWGSGQSPFYDDPPASPAGAPSTPALAAYWTFDDTADDVIGPNEGALNGPAGSLPVYSTNVPSQIGTGKSLEFNGTNNFFSAVPTGSITGSYTVSAWVQVRDNTPRTIFATRGPTDFGFDMRLQNGGTGLARVGGQIGTGSAWMTTSASGLFNYALNTWYHVAMVVRPNGYRVFVGGTQRGTATLTQNIPLLWDSAHQINIGRLNSGAGSQYFNGLIDNVAVWTTALSAQEIAALANGASPLTIGPGHKGALRYIPISNDADSQISSEKTYTHAVDFGNGPVANVNGVQFTQNFLPGAGSTNIPATFASDGTHNTSGNVAQLFDDFIYNQPEATVTLNGLTPGQAYDTRLYIRQWGSVFDRSNLLEFDVDGDGGAERTVRLNTDDARMAVPDFADSNQAYALSYNFIAESSSLTIRITSLVGTVNTWHMYGLTNELTDYVPLESVYGTGLQSNGAPLVRGTADPHYTLLAGAPQGTTAIAITNHTSWAANDAGSSFIGVAEPGTASIAPGNYTYRTTFDITGLDPNSAVLTATMFADDGLVDVLVNGVSKGLAFTGFTLADGRTFNISGDFVRGTNTIDFVTNNAGTSPNPGGFRVDLSGRARSPVPLPRNTQLAEGRSIYYFRHEFQFPDDPARTALRLDPVVDDGAIFYLNGVEVYRRNMPPGPASYSTLANGEVEFEPSYGSPVSISSASLANGRNVLAVELHPAAGSQDVIYSTKLFADIAPVNPTEAPKLALNEIAAATDPQFYVELANLDDEPINLGGFVLSRSTGTGLTHVVLPSQTLAPGAIMHLTAAQLSLTVEAGDKFFLYMPNRAVLLDAKVVTNSLRGRSTEHDGRWLHPNVPTPGAANSFSFHDEIVINEIMYHARPTPSSPLVVEQSNPISIQAPWRYEQSGADLGTTWRDPAFNDASWGTGNAILYAGPFNGSPNPTRVAIQTLYNTGVDNNRVVLAADGAVDPHWTIVSSPGNAFGPNAVLTESDGFPIPPYLANDTISKWISPRNTPGVSEDAIVPPGAYTYRTTFDLTGFVPSSGSIAMQVASDNDVSDVLINGVSTGINYVGFGSLSSQFTITSGFVAGINTLDFISNNYPPGDNPAGFRAVISGTALPLPKNTQLNTGPTTHYFRNTFNFNGDASAAELQLTPFADDGAVYYLNGVEVYRQNMPPGAVSYGTLATTEIPGQPAFGAPVAISASSLVTGANVLAVEVHQASGGFADMSFGAELRATETISPARDFAESREEWIELFNRSNHAVDLGGWNIEGGIDFAFPPNTIIPAGGYAVLARDAAYLQSIRPSLSILGEFSGQLNDGGEFIQLEDASENPVDEVRYFDSGRWHGYADGGGSSLELIDPDADNAQAQAWAASNETGHSAWQTVTYRGVASASSVGPDGQWQEFHLGLLDSGEALLDDIRVTQNPATTPIQLIQNGTFESDAFGTLAQKWRVLGNHGIHGRTVVEPDPANPSNHVLHLVATGPTEHIHNHIETTLKNGAAIANIANGTEYEISYRVRWLAGDNQVNTRLYFNRLPKTTIIDAPMLGGTPGAVNSRYAANIGPTYSDFGHTPAVPPALAPVTVAAAADDPDGVTTMTLWYSVNNGTWQNVPMTLGGDGNYAGTIPGQIAGAVVQFYVEGTDGLGAVSTYPAAGRNSRALYQVNDDRARLDSAVHNVRLVLTPADANLLHLNTNAMSNEHIGATVVYDEQTVYYDVGVHLKGSERGRRQDVRISFNIEFQPDDLFRGVHDNIAIDRSGAGDQFSQKEIIVKHIVNHAGDIPGSYDDLIHVITPRNTHTGSAMLMMARYGDEFLDTQFNNGDDGTLYEYELIYYPAGTTDGNPESPKLAYPSPDGVVGVAITNLGDDKERYRWPFLIKNNRDRDDYSHLIAMAKTFALSGATYNSQINSVIDVDQWLRGFAVTALTGIGDSYTTGGLGHNLMLFANPEDGRVLFFPHDMDFAFSVGATSGLVLNGDLQKMMGMPVHLHNFYGHVHDIVTTTFNSTYMTPWINHYDALLPAETFGAFITYIGTRATTALSQINSAVPPVAFSITTNGGNDFSVNNVVATVAGNGWVNVRTIRVVRPGAPGQTLNLTWNTSTGWQATVPVNFGANPLTFEAYDFQGNLIATDTITITSTVSGRPLQDFLRVSELMYHPADPTADEIAAGFLEADDFEYAEFINTSTSTPLSLSGVRFTSGIDFDFTTADVTTLEPGQRLVIIANRDAFLARYGLAGQLIAGEYSGQLNNAGESLRLEDMNGAEIQAFTYDDNGPGWHVTTDGDGYSLVIVDPAASVSQWSVPGGWRPSCEINGSPSEADVLWADLGGDADVDLADLAILQLHLGMTGAVTRADGDINRDGTIDRTDVSLFLASLGRICPPTSGQSPAAAPAIARIVATGDLSAAISARGSRVAAARANGSAPRAATALRATALRSDAVDHVIAEEPLRESPPLVSSSLRARRRVATGLEARPAL